MDTLAKAIERANPGGENNENMKSIQNIKIQIALYSIYLVKWVSPFGTGRG